MFSNNSRVEKKSEFTQCISFYCWNGATNLTLKTSKGNQHQDISRESAFQLKWLSLQCWITPNYKAVLVIRDVSTGNTIAFSYGVNFYSYIDYNKSYGDLKQVTLCERDKPSFLHTNSTTVIMGYWFKYCSDEVCKQKKKFWRLYNSILLLLSQKPNICNYLYGINLSEM